MDPWDSVASVVPRAVLAYHGLDKETVEGWGGRFHALTGTYGPYVREQDVDMLIGNVYMGYTAISRYWVEASVLLNLRFLDLEPALIEQLSKGAADRPGRLPAGLMRGVDRDVATVQRGHGVIIYGREDLPDDFAYRLAKLYDEGREEFMRTRVHMALDPQLAPDTSPVRLHPGAERYYQEKGRI